jgi:hypothetical protein
MQFRPPPPPQVKAPHPAQRAPWSDRGCPLDTAGDRCLWHAGGTVREHEDGFQLWAMAPVGPQARPALYDRLPHSQPRRRRGRSVRAHTALVARHGLRGRVRPLPMACLTGCPLVLLCVPATFVVEDCSCAGLLGQDVSNVDGSPLRGEIVRECRGCMNLPLWVPAM